MDLVVKAAQAAKEAEEAKKAQEAKEAPLPTNATLNMKIANNRVVAVWTRAVEARKLSKLELKTRLHAWSILFGS